MTIQTYLATIISNVVSGLLINAPWFILIYFIIKLIGKEIREFAKQVPKFIEQYDKMKIRHFQIERALKR